MHPRQASLLVEAEAVLSRFMSRTGVAAPPAGGPVVLWQYEDPDGQKFFLEVKKTTVKSPFSGKSFSARPVRHTPAQVGKELKDERKDKTASQESIAEYMNRLAMGPAVLWQYTDPEGNLFWLDQKVTRIRSPYGGPAFSQRPTRVMPSQIGKILKEEMLEPDLGGSGLDELDSPW